jgi:FecCD transport family
VARRARLLSQKPVRTPYVSFGRSLLTTVTRLAKTALVLNLAPNPYAALEIAFWLLGSLEDRSTDHLVIAAPFFVASWVLLAANARAYRALTPGEHAAASLGLDPGRVRAMVVAGVALGGGAAVAVAGSIGFVGLSRDYYPTPAAAVPLIPHLRRHGVRSFAEPCCSDRILVRHLESNSLRCAYAGDIATGDDALACDSYGESDCVITNPPYARPLMHAFISHFPRIAPTWLLLEMDWAAARQAVPHLVCCSDIMVIGRLRWNRWDDDDRQGELRLVPVRRAA